MVSGQKHEFVRLNRTTLYVRKPEFRTAFESLTHSLRQGPEKFLARPLELTSPRARRSEPKTVFTESFERRSLWIMSVGRPTFR